MGEDVDGLVVQVQPGAQAELGCGQDGAVACVKEGVLGVPGWKLGNIEEACRGRD